MATYRYCPLCSHGQPSTDGDVCARCGENMNSPVMPVSMADFANNLLRGFGSAQTGVPLPDNGPQKQLIFPPLKFEKAV